MDSETADRMMAAPWFYEFDLPDGRRTGTYLPEAVRGIHSTRLSMLLDTLDRHRDVVPAAPSVLDLACHEGWFAHHLAARGARVLGLDASGEHIERARLMAQVYGHSDVCFERRDVTRIEPHELGVFDVVLVLGLLYHVENPVGLLRIAHAHTRGVCVLETQVAPGLTGTVDWGSHLYPKAIVGSFAVIDETDQIAEGNPEANIVPISLVPSVETLVLVMQLVGFQRVEVLTPPPGAYEQLAHGKRVMVAGWVDGS